MNDGVLLVVLLWLSIAKMIAFVHHPLRGNRNLMQTKTAEAEAAFVELNRLFTSLLHSTSR